MMRLAFAAMFLVAGCDLYVGQPPPKPPVCNGAADFPHRDPETGECIALGDCDASCGECPENAGAAPSLEPDWASCNDFCEPLGEVTCLATPGCRAVYGDVDAGSGEGAGRTFFACWGTAPSGPIEGGGCVGLDAQACSEHDDCSAVYQDLSGGQHQFSQCIPEPPDLPPPPPPCDTLDEAACTARADCDAIYTGMDCTCDESGRCTCQSETFASCQPGAGG